MTSKFKCHLLSDIHLEFPGTFEKLPPIPNDAPYLFLVGDIGYPADEDYQTFLLEQSKRYKGVFVVAGNHEFYTSTYQQAKRDIQKNMSKKFIFYGPNKYACRWFQNFRNHTLVIRARYLRK